MSEQTDMKDYIFTLWDNWKSNAHCTHLQIAQADTQTKIYKRVQLSQPLVLFNN